MVTITMSLDDAGTLVSALRYYRKVVRFNLTAIHATEDERKDAREELARLDRIILGMVMEEKLT